MIPRVRVCKFHSHTHIPHTAIRIDHTGFFLRCERAGSCDDCEYNSYDSKGLHINLPHHYSGRLLARPQAVKHGTENQRPVRLPSTPQRTESRPPPG